MKARSFKGKEDVVATVVEKGQAADLAFQVNRMTVRDSVTAATISGWDSHVRSR